MKKILVSVATVSAFVLLALPVLAAAPAAGWYGSAKLGLFVPNDESDGLEGFDNGLSLEAAGGLRVNRNFAAELGLGWYSAEADRSNVDISVVPVTLTAKGILPLSGERLDLFAGAGVGLYFASVDSDGGDDSESAFGYHLMLGADYKLTEVIAAGIEAKWFWAEPEFGSQDVEVGGATYSATLKYLF